MLTPLPPSLSLSFPPLLSSSFHNQKSIDSNNRIHLLTFVSVRLSLSFESHTEKNYYYYYYLILSLSIGRYQISKCRHHRRRRRT